MSIKVRDFVAPREDPITYPGKRLPYSYLTDGIDVYRVKFEDQDIKKGIVYFKNKWCNISDVLKKVGSGNLSKKYPVLAYGSNASPGQLSYKFKDATSKVVLVLKGTLTDFDIIYGTSFMFRSVPAILVESLGTEVECWVTLLDKEQLYIMNESEQLGKDYSLGIFDSFSTVSGMTLKSYGYVGLMNVYKNKKGEYVALSEIKAKNRKFPERSQKEILKDIMELENIKPLVSKYSIKDVEGFLQKLKDDIEYKKEINRILNEEYSSRIDVNVSIISPSSLSTLDSLL